MSSKDNRYMEFRINEQFYALPLLTVKEVIQKPEITVIPNMPTFFEGMMNLRGQIIGVFNTKKRIANLKTEKSSSSEVIIVVEESGTAVGMIVDQVNRVIHVQPEQLGPAPLKEGDPASKFVTGVILMDEKLVLILSVDKLFELQKYATELNSSAA